MDATDPLARLPEPLLVDPVVVAQTVAERARVLIVLDDDPTGTQSVADLPVLTRWEVADLRWALEQGRPAVYVLTNTRSLGPEAAARRNREVVERGVTAARELGLEVTFVSRGDSTLRGHFPLETDVIADTLVALGEPRPDAVLLVPAFPDAGRITVDSVHYSRVAGRLTPVGETEFARDATFGYTSSDLRDYVAEKTEGRVPASEVVALTLETIRRGPDAVAEVLEHLEGGGVVVVDAVIEDDLRVLALGLARAETAGRRFLARVGPPFARARIGQEVAASLTIADIPSLSMDAVRQPDAAVTSATGGLIVVGSHVALTTRQLAALRVARPGVATVELSVSRVIDESTRAAHLDTVVGSIIEELAHDDIIVHTSRDLVTGESGDASLDISRRVSAAVVEVVQRVLAVSPPRFVIAKGGITSSDVASEGLSIRHAIVRGPMLPGIVSLWEPVDGPARGIPYIVFAGNVGDDDSLAAVVDTLSATARDRAPRAVAASH